MVAKSLILKLTAFSGVVLLIMLVMEGNVAAVNVFISGLLLLIGGMVLFWASVGGKFLTHGKDTALNAGIVLGYVLLAFILWLMYVKHLDHIESMHAWSCDVATGGPNKGCTGLYGPPGLKNSLIYGSLFLMIGLFVIALSYIIFYLSRLWLRKSRH